MNSAQCVPEPIKPVFSLEPCVYATPLKGTVILVEDDRFLRDLAGDVLECAGHRVLKAHSAEMATTLFRRHGRVVDLLLTDVMLPGKSGRELAKQMRERRPALKVMFISGYAQNPGLRARINGPGTCYLQKPFSAHSLLKKIDQLLASR
jgi:DNA-binding response OmpR family regulator